MFTMPNVDLSVSFDVLMPPICVTDLCLRRFVGQPHGSRGIHVMARAWWSKSSTMSGRFMSSRYQYSNSLICTEGFETRRLEYGSIVDELVNDHGSNGDHESLPPALCTLGVSSLDGRGLRVRG